MKYRALDSSGDYSFGKNMQNFLVDNYAIAQAIKTRLLLLLMEWWEDTNDGLPVFQQILGKFGTPDRIKAADLIVKERILGTQGVTQIVSFQSDYTGRRYTVSNVAVLTNTGQTVTVTGVTF